MKYKASDLLIGKQLLSLESTLSVALVERNSYFDKLP